MKKKWTKSNGFTLAELLIVVAIIAVLVAISIPIFTSQLEKAREATDLSDVRSAYAEVMMAAISDDTTATYSKDPNQTIHKSNGLYSVTVSPLHQEQDNWQGNMDLNVGGVSSKDTTHWIGTPKATGSCEVSYNPLGDSVVLNWSGKSTGGGNTGGGGTVTPGGSTTGGGSTPAPNPGTGGGTSGGDTNQGNSGSGSTETPSTEPGNNIPDTKPTEKPSETKPSESEKDDSTKDDVNSILTDLNSGDWPPDTPNTTCTITLKKGQIVSHNGSYYVWVDNDYSAPLFRNNNYNHIYYVPSDNNIFNQRFIPINDSVLHTSTTVMDWQTKVTGVKRGDFYRDKDGNLYMCNASWSDSYVVPPLEGDQTWIKILPEQPKNWYSYTDLDPNA